MKHIRIILAITGIIALLSACNTSDTGKDDTGDTVQAKENVTDEDGTAAQDDGEEAESTSDSSETSQSQPSDRQNDQEAKSDTKQEKEGRSGSTKQRSAKDDHKQSEERDSDSEPLTKKQAEELVRRHLELDSRPEVKVQYDHDEDGRYVIHVFEIVDQGESSHSATLGWYYVDPKTQKIESMF